MTKAILAIVRFFAYCGGCWNRTDQDKVPGGWRCRDCGAVVDARGELK